ncbi:hypothetical protein [Nocardia abscessus]|uniref:hypothetical protein n=1 Tax=Nocardia abscessus TaxID=120957 RepID=UPI002458D5EA|nr:hypothetical protein [Nocardia abscessus]
MFNSNSPQPGDRVRIAEIDKLGQFNGSERFGIVLPGPSHDDGFARVQVDGIARPLVFATWRLEAAETEAGDFSEAIRSHARAAIAADGRTNAEIAAAAGMSEGALESVLGGRSAPFVRDIVLLSVALGVSISTWFRQDEYGKAAAELTEPRSGRGCTAGEADR